MSPAAVNGGSPRPRRPPLKPATLSLPLTLPAELPADWRRIGAKPLVRKVVTHVAKLETSLDDFFGVAPGSSPEVAPSTDGICDPLKSALVILRGLADSSLVNRDAVADFFPNAITPKSPAPEDLVAQIALSVFRGTIRTLRKIVFEYVNLTRWEAWGAPDPLGLSPGDRIPPAMVTATKSYNARFYAPLVLARDILFELARSKPVRKRLADDVNLLDALCLAVPCSPAMFIYFFCPSNTWPMDIGFANTAVGGVFESLSLLCHVSMDSNRPWNLSRGALKARGYFPALSALMEDIDGFLASTPNNHTPGSTTALFRQELTTWTDALSRSLGIKPTNPSRNPAFRSIEKDALRGQITDSCDSCGVTPAGGQKMKRCTRCRTARYCSAKCHKEAWEKGHRRYCVDARGLVVSSNE